jgi:hypothetical protein
LSWRFIITQIISIISRAHISDSKYNPIKINCNFNDTPPSENLSCCLQEGPHVLDTGAFEKKFGREDALTHQAWIKVARNYVCFSGEVGKDSVAGGWFKRWDQHFGFFEG